MALPSRQHPLDWLTQYWNIALGKKVETVRDDWLVGPIGEKDENASRFLDRLAKTRDLRIDHDLSGSGLLENLDEWGVSVRPEIEKFYLKTSEYELMVQTVWRPVFGSLGYLVAKLFSRRIQQLNLPQVPFQGQKKTVQSDPQMQILTL
ncbi:MAG: hypothetical protein JJU29_09160 [Verrucomicrobia bacterium]|nr:hypothetical protein [Verrucomicrobiota bacterium]MCH8514078.1 hypothetical protein [Kiritimatiellia bacterium]